MYALFNASITRASTEGCPIVFYLYFDLIRLIHGVPANDIIVHNTASIMLVCSNNQTVQNTLVPFP